MKETFQVAAILVFRREQRIPYMGKDSIHSINPECWISTAQVMHYDIFYCIFNIFSFSVISGHHALIDFCYNQDCGNPFPYCSHLYVNVSVFLQ